MKPSKDAHRGLKRLLKYVSFRENPEHFALPDHERWTDCGLGDSWKSVYEKLVELKGPYVLTHHMVISPAPDLMELVPDDLKYEVVREVTERTIETWHLERGLSVPQYAHVLHDRDTSEFGLQQLHSHVFIAGTIENSLGERESHRVNREQVVADPRSMQRADNLHRIARQEMETLLDRTIGLEWRDLRQPEEEMEPQQMDLDNLMRQITADTPEQEHQRSEPPSIEEIARDLGLEL